MEPEIDLLPLNDAELDATTGGLGYSSAAVLLMLSTLIGDDETRDGGC